MIVMTIELLVMLRATKTLASLVSLVMRVLPNEKKNIEGRAWCSLVGFGLLRMRGKIKTDTRNAMDSLPYYAVTRAI